MGRVDASWKMLRLHPGRSRAVIKLAYPVSLGMLSITLLGVVDTAMLGRLGSAPLAAAGISAVGYFTLIFSLAGIGIGVQTITARRFGEGNRVACGEVLIAGVILAIMFGLPFVVGSGVFSRVLSPLLSRDPQVAKLGEIYLHYRFLGAAFLIVNMVYRGFFNGVGDTKKQLHSAIIVTVVNVLLDYLLIFGHGGFPRMGIKGAAIASTIATGIGTVYFLIASLAPHYRSWFIPYRCVPGSMGRVIPILRLSGPVMAQRLVANGSFFAFFTIVSRIGTLELAASNVIRSVLGLSIMPAIGLGVAAAAMVGQNLGAQRSEEAETFAWEAVKLASYLMGGIGLLFVAFPRWIFAIYTNDPAVIALGRIPLIILGVTQALDGVAIVLSQGLQGAGNTRYVMVIELLVCGLIYLPVAYLFGLRFHGGIVGAWSGEFVYWFAFALLMAWKFKEGGWKRIRV